MTKSFMRCLLNQGIIDCPCPTTVHKLFMQFLAFKNTQSFHRTATGDKRNGSLTAVSVVRLLFCGMTAYIRIMYSYIINTLWTDIFFLPAGRKRDIPSRQHASKVIHLVHAWQNYSLVRYNYICMQKIPFQEIIISLWIHELVLKYYQLYLPILRVINNASKLKIAVLCLSICEFVTGCRLDPNLTRSRAKP